MKIRIEYVLKSADVGTLFSSRYSENSSHTHTPRWDGNKGTAMILLTHLENEFFCLNNLINLRDLNFLIMP